MDRNKSAYKLKDFGPLYIINLDGQPERWQWMKDQLDYWQVTNYERMSAFDGLGWLRCYSLFIYGMGLPKVK